MAETRTLDEVYVLLEKIAVKLGVDLEAPPPAPVGILFPTGTIQTRGLSGQPYGVPWSNIARWEPWISEATAKAGNRYHPLLLAAFIVVESAGKHYTTNAKTGTPEQVIHGLGDARSRGMLQIRCDLHSAADMTRCLDPKRHLELGAKLLADWIVAEGSWEAALAERWHPGTDPSSGIGPPDYIRIVRDLIKEVKAVWPDQPPPEPEPGRVNPFRKPVIYTLNDDYARYGLTRAQANRILDNFFANRNGGEPRFIVSHIQDGTTPGSLDWWADGPGVQASSTVMANKDGSILRIIPEEHGPWTNGEVCRPTPKSAGLRALGGNPNNWSLTLEAEGEPGITLVTYAPAQEESICWQYADWMIRHELHDAEKIVLSHASIDQCNRPGCPGEQNHLRVLKRMKDVGF